MRTTLNIDDDVLEMARRIAEVKTLPFRVVVNEALRAGLALSGETLKVKPYRSSPRAMKTRSGISLDNIQEVLSMIETEAGR